MKLALHITVSVCFSLLALPSQSDAIVWTGKAEVTAVQGESATLTWNVTLDSNKAWTYVKIYHAEGANTSELVTYGKAGRKIIHIQNYESRRSDMTFAVSQSGSSVSIRFTLANLNRTTDMRNYKPVLGFSNDASTYPKATALTILVKPHSEAFKIEPQKDTFCLGDKVNLTCRAYGIPPPHITLSLNNHLVQSGNTSVEMSSLPLNVKGENNFICVPKNTAGVGQTRNVKLTVKEPPNITGCRINGEEVTSKLVVEDRKVIVSCDVTGSQPLYIAWYKGDVQKSLSQSNTLTFDSINRKHSGQYRVTAYNGRECEKTVTKILHLTVMYLDKPVVQGNAYKVVNPENPDQEAQFKVTVDGNPNPGLTCDREGMAGKVTVVKAVSGSKTTFSVTIYINKPFVGDEEYICKLSNTGGTRRIKFHLYKENPPISVKGTLTLTNVTWTEDLNNPSSTFYRLIKEKVTEALDLVYGNQEFVSRAKILRFVKGSVVVNFELYIIANVTDPISLLIRAVEKNGGQLNGLMINAASIKKGYSKTNEDGKKARVSSETDKALELGLGLGLGLPAIVLLLGLIIYCYCRIRKGPGEDECSSDSPGPVVIYQSENEGRSSSSNEMIHLHGFEAKRRYPDGTEDSIKADKLQAKQEESQDHFLQSSSPNDEGIPHGIKTQRQKNK